MADLDYFDPRIVTGVINKRPRKHVLFTDMFHRQQPSAAEVFELHIVSKGISMLPAITNHSAGTMRQGTSREVVYLKAPRFRPKRGFRAADIFKQPAGANPYQPMEDPRERAIAEDMDMHREEIDYTLEVMCAQAVVKGKVDLYDVVDGKKVPTYSVDFRRPPAHNLVLSGTKLWTAATSDLFDQIDAWDDMIQEETNIGSSDLYLGKAAWAAFREHKDVKNKIDTTSGVDAGQLSMRVGRKYKGTWNGLNIYVVSGTYADMDGTVRPFLEPEYALLVAAGAQTIIEFGRPLDLSCEGPVEVFAKLFMQDDPSGLFTLCETRPLPWIKQPGWVVLARVV